jgi:hypothetical protein
VVLCDQASRNVHGTEINVCRRLTDGFALEGTHVGTKNVLGGENVLAGDWTVGKETSEKAHIRYGTLQCDTSHFLCGPSSNNYM